MNKIKGIKISIHITYRKVASSRLSRLVAHSRISMKRKFDAYVLGPLAK